MIQDIKPLIKSLTKFARQRMGFQHPPKLFLKKDLKNSKQMLGKTAYYDPNEEAITLFVSGRHPKDILRSFAHELVHHMQKLRGEFDRDTSTDPGYAQKDPHMRDMEKEAYLQGNMCFRDWEDTLDDKHAYIIKVAESKFLKENNKMTKVLTKELLEESIRRVVLESLNSEQENIDEKHCFKRKDKELEEAEDAEGEVVEEEVEELEENEELEEKKGKKKSKAKGKVPKTEKEKKFAKLAPPKDKITFADKIAGATQVAEGKVQTPEQENTLYEQRFTPKNNRLFEKLLKEWTK